MKNENLKLKIQTTNRRGKSRRPSALRYPAALERKYLAIIREYAKKYEGDIRHFLFPHLGGFLSDVENQGLRLDSWVDDLIASLDVIEKRRIGNLESLPRVLDDLAKDLGAFNQKQFRSLVSKTLAVDVFLQEPWLSDELKAWSQQNARLVSSIPQREHSEISRLAIEGVRQGRPVSEIQTSIEKRFGVMESRAKTIARTEVSKLNGELTERRQRDLGIEMYYWRTSRDERVRDSHLVLDGRLCRYDDDTVFSDDGGKTWRSRSSLGGFIGSPGEDINCRCDAAPAVDLLLDEIGV